MYRYKCIHISRYRKDIRVNCTCFAGLDKIHHLTINNRKLSIDLEDHGGEVRTANYTEFYIDDGSTKYVLHVSTYYM